ncbi:hypothetical protein [Sphingobium sp. TCM1]|uniref:hypothetical protein n=1 Tax=Sphingobium sp. TCM1 TaxID=453246 RepID=UPI0007F544E2|nr:hypothetical protein [Sphingobium sp. TCM1]OAN53344.1 hypothetical protein A7Q26_04770 [Sphingobium sp. TCM1]
MDDPEISYLLRRCCSHRALARVTACPEAHYVHQDFVRRYQHRLLAVRRARDDTAGMSGAAGGMMSPLDALAQQPPSGNFMHVQ